MATPNHTISELISLLQSAHDIIECPKINTRLVTGYPDAEPIVWINDELQTEARSAELAEAARESDAVELVEFRGKNGLNYYRYALKEPND